MSKNTKKRSNLPCLVIFASWSVLIMLFFTQERNQYYEAILKSAEIEGRASYNKDLVYRRWAASHGGLYAPATEETPPNPYLGSVPDRDIQLASGKKLTLINPAYMTRQVHELAEKQYGVKGHITSLKPLRPENEPDSWERKSLEAFEAGVTFTQSVEQLDDEDFLRTMYPMVTEDICLKCHAEQGYQVGKIRGGISVSVPLKPYQTLYAQLLPTQVTYFSLIWLCGTLGILIVRSKINQQFQKIGDQLVAEKDLSEALAGQKSALKESENRLRLFIEHAPVALAMFDTEMRYLGVSRRWLADYGLGDLYLTGLPHYEVFPEIPQKWREDYQKGMEGEVVKSSGEKYVRADGLEQWLRREIRPWFKSDKTIGGIVIFTEDITERQHTEDKLSWEVQLNTELAKLSNKLIEPIDCIEDVTKIVLESARFLTDSTHGFVSEIDPITADNVIHSVTQMMNDYPVITRPDAKLSFSADGNGRYSGLWGESLNTGKSFFTNSAQEHSAAAGVPEGHIAVDKFLTVPVRYNDEIVGQIALSNPLHSYTDTHLEAVERLADLYAIAIYRQRINNERMELTDRYVRSSQLATLGELSAGVAHEINNPINGIINYAQLILNKADENSIQEDLGRRIIKEGDRVAFIVKKLLSFSRKEEGNRNQHSIKDLVEVPISLTAKALEKDGIKIVADIEEPITVLCNEQEMEQVFLNLINNAQYALNKKYPLVCKEKRIEISAQTKAKQSGSFTLITCKDFGIGIQADVLPRVFETFFTTKEIGAGTGLGLSIIESIIKNHNGKIRIDSVEGIYTNVLIELPLPEISTEQL